MKFAKALAIILVIPVIGIAVAQWVLGAFNAGFSDGMTIQRLCANASAVRELSAQEACAQVRHILWMRAAAVVTAVAGLALLGLFVATARSAGTDRRKMTRVFRPLVFGSLVVLAILVLIQGAILTYAVYWTELMLFERWHIYLVGAVALGALAGGFGLLQSCFELTRKAEQLVLGVPLSRQDHPGVFGFASELATTLGAREPDHIVVGLEPNFFVTSADIKLQGTDQVLSGETLYLSLPLTRIFSRDEIKAVVGHELGHFRGDDTLYSLRFAPVYAGLSHGVNTLGRAVDLTSIAQLPARSVLEYMIDVFHRNVSEVSRAREFEADKAATEVAPSSALATSLLKVGLYASAWGGLQQNVANRMSAGRLTRNMSSLFASIVKYDVNEQSIPKALGAVAQHTISHPTDSHPPTAARLAQFDIDVSDVDPRSLLVRRDNGVEIIEDHLAIEESLTEMQQKMYVAMGVQIPDTPAGDGGGTLIAAFGAHMVVADGQVLLEEIDHAEGIGRQMIETFDHLEFREFCHYPETLPDLDTLFEVSG
ncbi:MAG: M48 family metallopeptidase, partial [Pseudomonadota bacterium]